MSANKEWQLWIYLVFWVRLWLLPLILYNQAENQFTLRTCLAVKMDLNTIIIGAGISGKYWYVKFFIKKSYHKYVSYIWPSYIDL